MQHLTREQAEQVAASQPGSRVFGWSESSGERRADAMPAALLAEVIEALKKAVIRELSVRPGMNELMLRWQLSRRSVEEVRRDGASGLPEGYTWGTFAQQYPTFWSKLTSASTARTDVIIIHTMLDARRRFEEGELASEEAVHEQIYSDMIALNIRKDRAKREAVSGASAGSGASAAAAGSAQANQVDERALLQKARLRREFLKRAYASVLVPTEELARLGIPFKSATSVLHAIRAEDEARKTKGGGKPGKAQPPPLTTRDVMFGRMLLEVRVAIAKRHGHLPEPLDPKGAVYMPTYTRSAQLDLRWSGQDVSLPAGAPSTSGS